MSAGRRPFAPRRLLRPIRWLVLLTLAGLLWFGLSDVSLLRLPAGEPALFHYPGGARVLVTRFDEERPPLIGDAVFFLAGEQRIGFGRLVATAGDALQIDPIGRRVRRFGASTWYPATAKLLGQLPLDPGQVLVMAENPLRREAGAVLEERHLIVRVFAVLPF